MAFTNLSDETIVGPSGHQPWKGHDGLGFVANYYWDTGTLAWVKLSGTSTGPAANVTVTNFPSTYAVTQSTSPWVISGTVTASGLPVACATPTLANTSASASSVTVLAANANRKKAFFYNDSTSVCYLKFGSSASSTSFTHKLQPDDNFIEDGLSVYTGIVTAVWASATGTLRTTEVTV